MANAPTLRADTSNFRRRSQTPGVGHRQDSAPDLYARVKVLKIAGKPVGRVACGVHRDEQGRDAICEQPDVLEGRRYLDTLFADFDRQLKERGYLAIGGQIVDVTLVAAPKQRNTQVEKAAIKEGKKAGEIWPGEPARAAQRDTDARWTLKFAKAKPTPDGKPDIDIAIPSFGYKSSISICRAFGFIRKSKVTNGARFDGRMLRDVVMNDNTASDVWADTAYRSQANEKWLKRQGRVSHIDRVKPRDGQMPEWTTRANAAISKVRAHVEHVFAQQKDKMGLFIRTIGIKRAEAKITLANLAYSMNRLIFHERRASMG
mgnify:CR=1 FL=1